MNKILKRDRTNQLRRLTLRLTLRVVLLSLLGLAVTRRAEAAGTWAPLAHAPPAGLNNAMLVGDGTVMCGDGGSGWYRLTPDIHGSYVNGTWTAMAATHYTRLFYSSDVLTNGNVYVAGGEYGTGRDRAELYNTLNNTWTEIPRPAATPVFSDAVSKLLPNGNVLQGTTGTGVWIYNPVLNTITATASARNQNETCWVRLTNDNILTIDAFGVQSEHFVPSLGSWVNDGNTPANLFGYGGELGAGFVLPNGKAFYFGATTHTAIYTPGASVSSAGTWVAGPEMVFGGTGLGAVDAPAAMMANGKILCALGPTNGFNGPTSFYEYDYVANSFAQVNGPTGVTLSTPPFATTMLDLPDGGIFYIAGQGSTAVYVYTPDGSPLAQGQPSINNITENADGTFHLTGTGLNGITGGAAYGDDWQMDSNYPLVRMTNTLTGNVYYARTYGWNNTTIMTGTRVVATEFSLQAGLPVGTYSLIVSANGNPSAPVTFDYSPPAAPTGLSATIGNTQLALRWNAVPGATAYNVKRSTTSGLYFLNIATVSGTNYTNSGLVNGTTYFYVVTAVGSGGPSANSAQLAAAPFGPPPAPTGLAVGPDSYLGLAAAWNPSPGAASYNLKRSTTSGGPYATLASPANPDFNDTNVLAGTNYYYVVSAVSAGGESANSAQASATASMANDATNGLVANWKLDDNGGTTANDSSGNNNTGSLLGSPVWVAPGRLGASALSFAAASLQTVTAANSASLNMTAGITIAAWINAIDWNGNRRILQKGNSDNQYRLLAENGLLKFHLNGVGTLTTDLPPTNIWVHLAATWNGSTMAIYTNGSLQATQAAAGAIAVTADLLAIAKKNGSSTAGDFFNGTMDEVRIYNRGLSVPEITTAMHAGDNPPGTPTGLAAIAGNVQVSLLWTPVSTASSYNVKRANVSGGPYSPVGVSFAANYVDAGLTNGTTYFYVVSAVNSTNESANSSQASARPGIGVNFFADANYHGAGTQLLLAGNYTLASLVSAGIANDTASSCRVPNGWTVTIYQNDGFGGNSWLLASDTPDFAAVSGLNNNMSSCRIVTGGAPATPGGFTAVAGDTQVAVSWNPVAGASAYNLKRATNGSGPYAPLVSTASTSYTDTGLANGTTYYYVVSSVSTNGESANSGSVNATPFASPIVLTLAPQAAGQFSFQFDGVNGRNYVVELSTNLVDWVPVFTNQPVAGVFLFSDTTATDPARFYRVKQ